MIQQPFDAIAKPDIDALVDDRVKEFKTLEYKQELPGTSDDSKKEFLADVSSFANASGGDIIFGVKAAIDAAGKKTGAPESVQPITGTTPDVAKLRLESMIRDNIAPRVRVQIKEVAGWGPDWQGFVLLLRIPQSFASPHMVTFRGAQRFFSRNSAGKYQLDVRQLRDAFLATESQSERIKRFREDRLGKVVANETPVLLSGPWGRLVLHLIPISSFLNNESLNLANDHILRDRFRPIHSGSLDARRNLDGFVTWIPAGEPPDRLSYCQLFSHGAVEAVGAGRLLGGMGNDNRKEIASDNECDVVDAVERYLGGYKQIGIIPPVVIALSLLGCKGAYLRHPGLSQDRRTHSIDRDAVILPDRLIESLDGHVPQVMKPIFDMLWNAFGFPAASTTMRAAPGDEGD